MSGIDYLWARLRQRHQLSIPGLGGLVVDSLGITAGVRVVAAVAASENRVEYAQT
jgi:hypothetical protein